MVKVVVAVFLPASIFVCSSVLADRDGSEQEQYYLKNFRNKNGNGEFLFLRNRDSLRKDQVRGVVDILPHNPYGEHEDHSIPTVLIVVPLLAAWIALLILISHSTPQVATVISNLCRQISEFTRTLSDRMAAMHDRNRQSLPEVDRKTKSTSKRRERNQQFASSDPSISPSLIEIANMAYESDDGEFGQSTFSSLGRAKTVVASNTNHHNVLREPSPLRESYSKHSSIHHAPSRIRQSNDNEHDVGRNHQRSIEQDKKGGGHRDTVKRYNKHANDHHGYRPETPCRGSSGHDRGHAKYHYSPSNKHRTHDLTPLEKMLSAGKKK